MNPYAYRTTGLALKTLSTLLKARVRIHGKAHIPDGSLIFVINHFTRIETLLIPYHINRLTDIPVWSLADYGLFKGALGTFLDKVGAVSTRNPDRDRLIVKSLLTGEAAWIIFPEGRMVKSRKIIEKGRFMVSSADGMHPPHSGAAALALRAEFYRHRLQRLERDRTPEGARLLELFQIESAEQVHDKRTFIVPVNVTYYPIRARENILSSLAARFVDSIPERILEELMTEGTMLLSGVDIDIRFGPPIDVYTHMGSREIQGDISDPRPIDFDDPIPSIPVMRKVALKLMNRYMSAIYGMTTVNHDHLFASMLRYYPFSRMDEADLRGRVFSLIAGNIRETGAVCHASLQSNQISLLTDDRFGKFHDFISLVEEKGIVRREGGWLVKNPAKFSSLFDFHRVRIDNPVAVMANEIEPLTRLERRIKRTAWLPRFWVRHRVADMLIREARAEFRSDYDAFYSEGKTKRREIGRPLLVRGKSRHIGVVLVHGYMAAPAEVRELALYLGRLGYWVYTPRLRGHGTSPEDLATRSFHDWIESVDRGYAIVSNICRNVIAGGFSTGAGLALDLASRISAVKAVFAISPPLRLQDLSARVVPAVDVWNRLMKKVRFEGARMEFVENHPENPHINYGRNPISGVREIERLMESLDHRLPHLTVPAMVAQSHRDPVVDQRGSKRIFDRLGSEDKRYVLFNFERHGILLGEGSERVHRAVGDFLGHLDLAG